MTPLLKHLLIVAGSILDLMPSRPPAKIVLPTKTVEESLRGDWKKVIRPSDNQAADEQHLAFCIGNSTFPLQCRTWDIITSKMLPRECRCWPVGRWSPCR